MKSLIDLVGNTPLLEVEENLFAKLEFQNPGGSVKDRAALGMVQKAEDVGELKQGGLIVEPTSGNTGISLAWIGKAKGYNVKLVMPESMSIERRKLMLQFGAELVLTPAEGGMKAAIEKAQELAQAENGWIPNQFTNSANPETHEKTTGPEIWKQIDEKLDFFVAGVGTGGTISGAGKFLKSKNPEIKIVAVEPEESAVISGEEKGAHKIQGIGAGFIPDNLDKDLVDEIIKINSAEAIETSRNLAAEKGVLVGISSGANLAAARKIVEANPGKRVATIFCDGGERYISTDLFA